MRDAPFDYDAAWAELPADIRDRAVAILRRELLVSYLEDVKRLAGEYGLHEWAFSDPRTEAELAKEKERYGFVLPASFHMGQGMGIRNLLRRAGLLDEMLPLVPTAKAWYQATNDGAHPSQGN